MNCPAFETMSKRRKGFPFETHVKRGERRVHGGKLLEEKLGHQDLCPYGSHSFETQRHRDHGGKTGFKSLCPLYLCVSILSVSRRKVGLVSTLDRTLLPLSVTFLFLRLHKCS